MANLLKHALPYRLCVTMPILVVLRMGISTGKPPKIGSADSLEMGGVAEPKIHAPPPHVLLQIW